MTTFVEMALLWLVRLFMVGVILFVFFQTNIEIPVYDIYAEVVYDFGGEVPQEVLMHTTDQWRREHNCYIGYVCKGEVFWEVQNR